jgi:hypothetical protein
MFCIGLCERYPMQPRRNSSLLSTTRVWPEGTARQHRSHRNAIATSCLLAFLIVGDRCIAQTQQWIAQGPGPNKHGQVENIKDGEVIGAIRTVAPHPTNGSIVYVGAVNGGIWKTSNAMSASPNWNHQTDDKKSLSIGALEFDPTDPSHQTLVAGTGRFSSFGDGGALTGLLRTTNGGVRWVTIDGKGALLGLNISGVAPRGKTIVVSANDADDAAKVGIWRTESGGSSWKHISGGDKTGLPTGASAGVASDPTNPKRLFVNAGNSGLYRSNDSGATWTKVSDSALDALINNADNLKIAVGMTNNVYVAVDVSGVLAGVFRSRNGGTSWTPMDLPNTDDGGIHPGKQGGTDLSISADPRNVNVVYIGGDRQPAKFVDGAESDPPKWPNSIGAWNYSGRLFRGDASKPIGGQWVHLTHSKQLGAAGGGTASSSAPHGDSRAMSFAANGTLIEVDDGGIYRRTSPQTNEGDWFSMNGNMQDTEFHSVAWDANAHVVVGGAQDTGTPAQYPRSTTPWQSISTSDGGVVAVDTSSSPGYSVRYSSAYSLLGFRRQLCDSKNVIQAEDYPQLKAPDNGSVLKPQFYTPIKLNSVAPTRLIIGAANSVYESPDQGDTISEIGPGIVVNDTGANAIAYGAKGNPDILYVGSGALLFVRNGASPTPLVVSPTYAGGYVVGIAIDPNDSKSAFVVSTHGVFQTTDAGINQWTDITGNLPALHPGVLRSIAYNPGDPNKALVVGADIGVFVALGPQFSNWSRLSSGLPNAPVYHIEYSTADNIYLAGTLGRGAWTLKLSTRPPTPGRVADEAGSKQLAERTSGQELQQLADQKDPNARGATSAESDRVTSFKLSSGVVVDTSRRRIYATSVDGGIAAVDFSNGKHIWINNAAAKPIGMAADRLVCQAEAAGKPNDLKIVALDPATGDKVSSGSVTLPEGVQPSVTGSLKGDFVATADTAEGGAIVYWQFVKRPQQGRSPHAKATLRQSGSGASDVAPVRPDKGTFRMNLTTGAVSASPSTDAGFPETAQQKGLDAAQAIDAVGERQFLSADRRDIVVTKKTGGEMEPKRYTLTIYDRRTNARLGELKSHFSVLPFFVSDSMIIYESAQYGERTAAGFVQRPRRLVASDLKTGLEVWALDLPAIAYSGSFPP